MNNKRKILSIIVGVEAVLLVVFIALFIMYFNSDTVKAKKQLELAQRYLLEEDYEQAIAAFEQVIEIEPKLTEAYLGLAEAYIESGDTEKALEVLQKGYKITDAEELQEQIEICEEILSDKKAEQEEIEQEIVTKTEEETKEIEPTEIETAVEEAVPKLSEEQQQWVDEVYTELMAGEWTNVSNLIGSQDKVFEMCGAFEDKEWAYWDNENAFLMTTSEGFHLGIVIYDAEEICVFSSEDKSSGYGLSDIKYEDTEVDFATGEDGAIEEIEGFLYNNVYTDCRDGRQIEAETEDEIFGVWHM